MDEKKLPQPCAATAAPWEIEGKRYVPISRDVSPRELFNVKTFLTDRGRVVLLGGCMKPIIALLACLVLAGCMSPEAREKLRGDNERKLPPGCRIIDLDYGELRAAVVCEGRRSTTTLRSFMEGKVPRNIHAAFIEGKS